MGTFNFKRQSEVFSRLTLGACLLLSLLVAIYLRTYNIAALEGKYLLGNDAYRFYYQAERIIENHHLPKRDMMRWLPLGRDLTTHLNFSSYLIAFLWFLPHLIIPSLTLYQVAVFYPILCYVLTLIILFLLIRKVFDTNVGLLSFTFLSISLTTLQRTSAGFADRDALCLLLFTCSAYFYVCGIQSSATSPRLIYAICSGIFMMVLGLTWEGVGLFIVILLSGHFAKFVFGDYRKEWH